MFDEHRQKGRQAEHVVRGADLRHTVASANRHHHAVELGIVFPQFPPPGHKRNQVVGNEFSALFAVFNHLRNRILFALWDIHNIVSRDKHIRVTGSAQVFIGDNPAAPGGLQRFSRL